VDCNTAYFRGSLTFRRNISLPSSGSERKVSKNIQVECSTLNVEVICSPRNFGFSPNYMACNPGCMFGKFRLKEIAAYFISLILAVLHMNHHVFLATHMIRFEAIIL
jgi:hypothetical protein